MLSARMLVRNASVFRGKIPWLRTCDVPHQETSRLTASFQLSPTHQYGTGTENLTKDPPDFQFPLLVRNFALLPDPPISAASPPSQMRRCEAPGIVLGAVLHSLDHPIRKPLHGWAEAQSAPHTWQPLRLSSLGHGCYLGTHVPARKAALVYVSIEFGYKPNVFFCNHGAISLQFFLGDSYASRKKNRHCPPFSC